MGTARKWDEMGDCQMGGLPEKILAIVGALC